VKNGFVWLVGAGPGDPELITLKGSRLLGTADIVLYDRLINRELLALARPEALLVDVGKAPGECGRPRQETINALLVEHARRGRRVVRLKGGDPFVFGRGGEEMQALRDAGISYEVVPGVSSAIAAAASAGIPVTHRGLSNGFAVFTAQSASEEDSIPWALAANVPTLILLMGVEALPQIVRGLSDHGRSLDTLVAVVERATWPDQRVIVGKMSEIVDKAHGVRAPATIVVGEVVSLHMPAFCLAETFLGKLDQRQA